MQEGRFPMRNGLLSFVIRWIGFSRFISKKSPKPGNYSASVCAGTESDPRQRPYSGSTLRVGQL
jgi:hypothetical protein